MNLHCNKIELYQTPTYITYMCTEPFDDDLSDLDFAVAALRQYLIWIKYGILNNVSRDVRESYAEHITNVQKLIDDPPKNLEVYIS